MQTTKIIRVPPPRNRAVKQSLRRSRFMSTHWVLT